MAIPKKEVIWMTYTSDSGKVYYITSSRTDRGTYFLYESDGKTVAKTHQAKSPKDLEKYMK